MKKVISYLVLALAAFLGGCARPVERISYAETISPTPPCELVFPPSSKQDRLIILDPGHGGEDEGTHSRGKNRMLEKDLTLYTTKQVKTLLEKKGYHVIITRDSDFFLPLHTRAQLANGIRPALFVSIHYNSAPSTDAQGIEVYYYETKENQKRALQSKNLAKSILDQMISRTKATRRGVRHGNFHVIRETEMPAVLIEGGFMTNEEEMKRLSNPSYILSLAEGIAEGINQYQKSP